MIKVLFLIHDLGQGGAEKVLVNLVNNMDPAKFDITVMTLFGGGVNEQFLKPHIRRISCFRHMLRGNSHLMKLLTPEQLHRWLIKDTYDVEISYLEGPSARIISGCPNQTTKLVSWIHVEQHSMDKVAAAFRNHAEARRCYRRFDRTVCVSEYVRQDFEMLLDPLENCCVLYNTVESEMILKQSQEPAPAVSLQEGARMVAVGTLKESKGYMRLLRIMKRLREEHYSVHLNILGIGPLQRTMEQYIADNHMEQWVTLLGYDTNPYKYVSKSDLLVCASFAEGFSTAATEALIVGTPVCTVDVSGMKEMLGENNEYGIVTENSEEALYQGIKSLLEDPALLAYYKEKAAERGRAFHTAETVSEAEKLFIQLMGDKK